MPENRNLPRTAFAKGASGNPGGRPKGYNAFRKRFRDKDDVEGVRDALKALHKDPSHKDHFNALKLWIEYGYGKAPSAPDDNKALASSGSGLPAGTTIDDLRALAKGEK